LNAEGLSGLMNIQNIVPNTVRAVSRAAIDLSEIREKPLVK